MSEANESGSGSSDGLHCSGAEGPPPAADFSVQGTPIVRKGYVVQRADGRKYVARRDHELPCGATIEATSPHEDGDYSYCCGWDYCRCMQ